MIVMPLVTLTAPALWVSVPPFRFSPVIVTGNYDRAREALTAHKSELEQIAEELLIREVLDADQVRRIAKGLRLEAPAPTPDSTQTPSDGEVARSSGDDTPSPIVPPVPSLDKAIPQE